MSELLTTLPRADRSQFSLHPEDDMTERHFHARQVSYFEHVFTSRFPELFVARNMAVYWVPGQRKKPYAGPDLFVSRRHPEEEDPSVYLTYEDGPIAFVVEVASEKTRAKEAKKRDETYAAALRIPEYLYVDHERDVLGLWRLAGEVYEPVAPDGQGRLWSEELGVWFAWQEDGRLVRVITADGETVPTSQEEADLRLAAEEQARRLAEEVERLRRTLRERDETA
jgi:Uma2 family endonuclease